MDLADLANLFKDQTRIGAMAVTDPRTGTTYGPAQSRYTRTNQQFIDDPTDRDSGHYYPQTKLKPAIERINITSPDITDVPAAIRHEDTHALLSGLSHDQLQSVGQNNPAMQQVVDYLQKAGRQGWAGQEVPAYMAENDPNATFGIPGTLRNLYLQHMVQQLGTINPVLSKKYKTISGYGGK